MFFFAAAQSANDHILYMNRILHIDFIFYRRQWRMWQEAMPLASLSLFQNNDVGHSVHLRQLFAVERCHQFPGPGLGRDKVFCQRHGGVTAHVPKTNEWQVNHQVKGSIEGRMRLNWISVPTPQTLRGLSAAPVLPLWRARHSASLAAGSWTWSWLPFPYRPQLSPKAAEHRFRIDKHVCKQIWSGREVKWKAHRDVEIRCQEPEARLVG